MWYGLLDSHTNPSAYTNVRLDHFVYTWQAFADVKRLRGAVQAFRKGRDVSAALGLVPKQHGTGGKTVLLGISKRGDRYLRSLLVHGARSVVRQPRVPTLSGSARCPSISTKRSRGCTWRRSV